MRKTTWKRKLKSLKINGKMQHSDIEFRSQSEILHFQEKELKKLLEYLQQKSRFYKTFFKKHHIDPARTFNRQPKKTFSHMVRILFVWNPARLSTILPLRERWASLWPLPWPITTLTGWLTMNTLGSGVPIVQVVRYFNWWQPLIAGLWQGWRIFWDQGCWNQPWSG